MINNHKDDELLIRGIEENIHIYNNRIRHLHDLEHPCLQMIEGINTSERHLQTYQGYNITESTLSRLSPNIWLNDEIINYYMQLLQTKDPISWYLNSFFMEQLKDGTQRYDYHQVESWTTKKNIDILPLERIYILSTIPTIAGPLSSLKSRRESFTILIHSQRQ
jgi:hypothetical protein